MFRATRSGIVRAIPLAVALVAGVPSQAGVVQNVNSPGLQYSDIQQAIDAASNGDVLLVTSGAYQPFTIDGKSLTLAATPGGAVTISGTIVVRNVPAIGEVDLLGLSANAPYVSPGAPADGSPGLVLSSNAGHVRIADGTFTGGSAANLNPGPTYAGGTGIVVVDSAQVVLIRCSGRGGQGSFQYCLHAWIGGAGGDGLRTTGSTLSIHGGNFRGGDGGGGDANGGPGGDGFRALDEKFLAAGVTFQGGKGGDCYTKDCSYDAGDGGNGINANGGPSKVLGITATGGPPGVPGPYCNPGSPGSPIAGTAIIVHYAGSARTLSSARIAADASAKTLTVAGVPGELVLLAASPTSLFVFVPPYSGTWLINSPAFFRRNGFVGSIGPSGAATLPFVTPVLTGPPAAVRMTMQCMLLSPGRSTLSDPELQVLIDKAALPDCNGNGVNDFLDVVQGTSPDVNKNLVPDECEHAGPDWYVDAAAPAGGSGSPLLPFQTLDRAFQVAMTGHVVHVADGTYTGPTNKNLNFAGRSFRLESLHGPASCIIDCQGVGRAFYFSGGETNAAFIGGFTIANASGQYNAGAIEMQGGSPTIEGCVFTHCTTQQDGGAIRGFNSSALITGCTFVANHAGPAGSSNNGGGALCLDAGAPHVVFCTFEDNVADRSGGAILIKTGYAGSPVVSHCEFRQNTGGGGAICVMGYNTTPAWIVNSLFAGNAGSAITIEQSTGLISSCTFSSNSGTLGGALRVRSTTAGGWSISNSILWGNGPVQIHLEFSSAQLQVDYCDIKGGQSSVTGVGTLGWGGGNIDANPLFLDPDLRLGSASPCLDAGDNTRILADVLDLDGDGNTSERVPLDLSLLSRFVDLPAPNTGNGTPPLVDLGCQERQTP